MGLRGGYFRQPRATSEAGATDMTLGNGSVDKSALDVACCVATVLVNLSHETLATVASLHALIRPSICLDDIHCPSPGLWVFAAVTIIVETAMPIAAIGKHRRLRQRLCILEINAARWREHAT